MIHLQQPIATKPASTKLATKLATKQSLPLPQQAVLGCAGMLVRAGFSGWNLLGRGLAIAGWSFDCEHALSVDGLSVDGFDYLSIDSSAYINRLEPTKYRSGERRRLAAIPS